MSSAEHLTVPVRLRGAGGGGRGPGASAENYTDGGSLACRRRGAQVCRGQGTAPESHPHLGVWRA